MTRKEIIALYDRYARRLYNMSLRIIGDAADAEEVMQDTVLKYVSLPLRPAREEQVSAWLSRTCIRASIDRLRRKRREALFLEEYAALEGEAAVSEDAREAEATLAADTRRVLEAMRLLPDPYRLVVTLVLCEGLDYAEIAALTGRKEATLRSLYARGRQKLMEKLQNDGKAL